MNSVMKSTLKLAGVAILLAWAAHVHAAGCVNPQGYAECMNGNYYSCSPVMQRCSENCQCPENPAQCEPNPPPGSCMAACIAQINACEAACNQEYCE
jgi:hypothetical protein